MSADAHEPFDENSDRSDDIDVLENQSGEDKSYGKQNFPDVPPELFTALRYGNDESMLQPFSRNIFLLKTNAAGCDYVENIEQHLAELVIGQKLTLLREPKNPVDKRAILIMNGNQKLGYIPRRQNEILSRLMDAGKYLYATVDDKLEDSEDNEFYYAALTISVYMQD